MLIVTISFSEIKRKMSKLPIICYIINISKKKKEPFVVCLFDGD